MRARIIPVLVCAAVVMGFAGQASAAVPDNGGAYAELPIVKANPQLSAEIVESLPDAVKHSAVEIAPDYQPGTPIYYPGGKLVEGQSAEVMRVAARCSRSVVAPIGGAWSRADVCPVALFGSPELYIRYSWEKAFDTTGCVQVRGYNRGTSPRAVWNTGGCGSFNSNVSVHWGNVLGNPAARAKSQSVVTGWTVNWQAL